MFLDEKREGLGRQFINFRTQTRTQYSIVFFTGRHRHPNRHYKVSANTRAKRLRMPKVSIFKLAVANANFTTRMPVCELKSNFISIQNFKAGNVKPPGMHWSKDF